MTWRDVRRWWTRRPLLVLAAGDTAEILRAVHFLTGQDHWTVTLRRAVRTLAEQMPVAEVEQRIQLARRHQALADAQLAAVESIVHHARHPSART